MNRINITTPLKQGQIESLHAGDMAIISGFLYSARDKAHERLCGMIKNGEKPPFDTAGQMIYYMGPSPAPPGRIIGAAGPTTSGRMDPFTEAMLGLGIKGFIGKGKRSGRVKELLRNYKAVYFAAFGGAAAYLSKRITRAEVIAFDDLGPEAIYRLKVEDFPVIVINDIFGGDLYER